MNTQTDILQIEWLIRRDLPEILSIDRRCFRCCWTDEDFCAALRNRYVIGIVAKDRQGRVVGFMVYELDKSRLFLQRLAVDPVFRRRGYASQMISRLVEKLNQQRRHSIALWLRESNLPAQLFFRARNFQCVGTQRGHFQDPVEDGHLMQYQLPGDDRSTPALEATAP